LEVPANHTKAVDLPLGGQRKGEVFHIGYRLVKSEARVRQHQK